MTSRSLDLIIIIVLAAYGIYVASYIPALLVGPAPLLLLVARIVEAVLAFMSAYAVWANRAWAASALVALGITVAIMWLIEAFVYGVVAYLPAVGAAIMAAVVTVLTASYVRHHRTV